MLAGILSVNAQMQKGINQEDVVSSDSLQEVLLTRQSYSDVNFAPQQPQVILPSPTSQVYTRFMGYQPNLSTGAVNVDIPLTTLDWDSFSLPLSFNYQSNGIKPSDPYRPCGYGWTLQPGLRITRTIMGKPDDRFFDRNVDAHSQDVINDPCYLNRMFDEAGHMIDSQYDVFTICLPAGNTSFVLKNTYKGDVYAMLHWEAVTLDSPLQIEVLQNASNYNNSSNAYIHGFKVTDENGVIYYFGNDDSGIGSTNSHVELSVELVPTTYLLREIILPGEQQHITFDWKVFNETTAVYQTGSFTFTHGLYQADEGSPIPGDTFSPFYTSGYTCGGSRLASISSDQYSVEFSLTSEYIDYIIVKNGARTVVKDIRLSYSDKLMQQIVINGVEKYLFGYNPEKFKYPKDCWDFWGYYNGKNNPYGYPSYYFDTYMYPSTSPRRIIGADMMPDTRYMSANLLEKVTYPTGGTTIFEYEPHRYNQIQNGGTLQMGIGGGLRVKRVITDAHDGNPQLIKTYDYGTNGYGFCTLEPNEKTYITQTFYIHMGQLTIDPSHTDQLSKHYAYGRTTISPFCVCGIFFAFNAPIWYNKVVEYSGEGKCVYRYDYEPDELEMVREIPYPADSWFSNTDRQIPVYLMKTFRNIFQRFPRITSKVIYTKDEKELSREEYRYLPYEDERLRGIAAQNTGIDLGDEGPSCNNNYYYTMIYNSILPIKHKLQQKTVIADGVTVMEQYAYSASVFNISSVTTKEKDGTVKKVEYFYANDSIPEVDDTTRVIYIRMKEYNRITQPVLQRIWVDDKLVASKQTSFQILELLGNMNNYQPLIVPKQEFFKKENSLFEPRISYKCYLDNGKVTEIEIDGKTISYIWGYLGEYPIAEVRNAAYQQIESLLGSALLDRLASSIIPSQADMKQVDELRNRLPQSVITTYAYIPAVGVISETSPAGQTIYYDYDNADRLKSIYRLKQDDDKPEMIEGYEYKY